MTAKKRQRNNVQDHFVTAAYLVGFTPTGRRDSQLYVYERNSERMFRGIPDEVAKRRHYYKIPTTSGELNDQVDVMITALEGQAMPSLRKLTSKDYNLSIFERAILAHLIAFQEFRTPWARANFQKMELSLTKQLMHGAANAPGCVENSQRSDAWSAGIAKNYAPGVTFANFSSLLRLLLFYDAMPHSCDGASAGGQFWKGSPGKYRPRL